MVGVPGRSKACNTCRKRKVACSLEKPECQTCIKASRVCTGYLRERVFILGPGAVYQGPKSQKTNSQVKDGNALSIGQKSNGAFRQRTRCDDLDRPPSLAQTVMIRPIPPNIAYCQQILSEFFTNFVKGARETPEGEARCWMFKPTAMMSDYTTVLDPSLLAVATASLGRLHNNEVLVHESLKFYANGLWELQKALWDPKLMYKDQTLAACMTLMAYEIIECPDKTLAAWDAHMKGCARLFEARGPNAYGSDLGYELFLQFRVIEIQQAFVERRPSFLSSSEWMHFPFKGRSKPRIQQLLDIAATMTDIISTGYRMLDGLEEGTVTIDPSVLLLPVLGLINRCWNVDVQLQNFYQTLEEETSGPVYWPELSAGLEGIDDSEELGKVFDVAFKYSDIQTARVCLFFWAISAMLWSGMAFVYRILPGIQAVYSIRNGISPSKTSAQFELPPLGHRTDTATLARNICKTIEFCSGDKYQGVGAGAVVFPLKVAIETLHDIPGCERELLWAQAAMVRISLGGLRMMSHLPVPMTDHAFLPA